MPASIQSERGGSQRLPEAPNIRQTPVQVPHRGLSESGLAGLAATAGEVLGKAIERQTALLTSEISVEFQGRVRQLEVQHRGDPASLEVELGKSMQEFAGASKGLPSAAQRQLRTNREALSGEVLAKAQLEYADQSDREAVEHHLHLANQAGEELVANIRAGKFNLNEELIKNVRVVGELLAKDNQYLTGVAVENIQQKMQDIVAVETVAKNAEPYYEESLNEKSEGPFADFRADAEEHLRPMMSERQWELTNARLNRMGEDLQGMLTLRRRGDTVRANRLTTARKVKELEFHELLAEGNYAAAEKKMQGIIADSEEITRLQVSTGASNAVYVDDLRRRQAAAPFVKMMIENAQRGSGSGISQTFRIASKELAPREMELVAAAYREFSSQFGFAAEDRVGLGMANVIVAHQRIRESRDPEEIAMLEDQVVRNLAEIRAADPGQYAAAARLSIAASESAQISVVMADFEQLVAAGDQKAVAARLSDAAARISPTLFPELVQQLNALESLKQPARDIRVRELRNKLVELENLSVEAAAQGEPVGTSAAVNIMNAIEVQAPGVFTVENRKTIRNMTAVQIYAPEISDAISAAQRGDEAGVLAAVDLIVKGSGSARDLNAALALVEPHWRRSRLLAPAAEASLQARINNMMDRLHELSREGEETMGVLGEVDDLLALMLQNAPERAVEVNAARRQAAAIIEVGNIPNLFLAAINNPNDMAVVLDQMRGLSVDGLERFKQVVGEHAQVEEQRGAVERGLAAADFRINVYKARNAMGTRGSEEEFNQAIEEASRGIDVIEGGDPERAAQRRIELNDLTTLYPWTQRLLEAGSPQEEASLIAEAQGTLSERMLTGLIEQAPIVRAQNAAAQIARQKESLAAFDAGVNKSLADARSGDGFFFQLPWTDEGAAHMELIADYAASGGDPVTASEMHRTVESLRIATPLIRDLHALIRDEDTAGISQFVETLRERGELQENKDAYLLVVAEVSDYSGMYTPHQVDAVADKGRLMMDGDETVGAAAQGQDWSVKYEEYVERGDRLVERGIMRQGELELERDKLLKSIRGEETVNDTLRQVEQGTVTIAEADEVFYGLQFRAPSAARRGRALLKGYADRQATLRRGTDAAAVDVTRMIENGGDSQLGIDFLGQPLQ